ncbi:CDC73 [Scenedesmus sp. PABB004]|nr:CDC73 [Scenedesmus sp. PABB004]
MDPLAILKEYCLAGQLDQVSLEGDRVRFSDKYSFPKAAPTAFRAKDGAGDHYSLAAVAFFIKAITSNNNMGQYVAAAIRSKTGQIDLKDREALRDYLTGKLSHTNHIADVVPTAHFDEPAAKKQRVEEPSEGEAAALKHLFEQEKQLRDRNSLLCAPGANFKPVLEMLDKVLAARKTLDAAAAAKPAAGGSGGKGGGGRAAAAQQQQKAAPAFMKPSGRMEREQDVGAIGADAAVVGQLGYGIGGAAPASRRPAAAAAAGGAPAPAPAPAGGRPGSGGSRPGSGGRPGSASHKAAAGGGAGAGGGGAGGRQRSGPPIILVPNGVTAMVNIFNAKQFLEEGRFVRSDEAAAAAGGVKPAKALEFNRTALRTGPRFPRYQITDKVPKAGHPDWQRVVAVILQGKAWQLKEFPFRGAERGELMETFSNLFGAFLHYSDEKVPDVVQTWKCAKLPLRRTARHLDHTVMLEFYAQLDAFLTGRRCELDF